MCPQSWSLCSNVSKFPVSIVARWLWHYYCSTDSLYKQTLDVGHISTQVETWRHFHAWNVFISVKFLFHDSTLHPFWQLDSSIFMMLFAYFAWLKQVKTQKKSCYKGDRPTVNTVWIQSNLSLEDGMAKFCNRREKYIQEREKKAATKSYFFFLFLLFYDSPKIHTFPCVINSVHG